MRTQKNLVSTKMILYSPLHFNSLRLYFLIDSTELPFPKFKHLLLDKYGVVSFTSQ